MTDRKKRVGFIGLGIMGEPMALNVMKAGFPLTVFNRTAAKCESLREAGAAVADSSAEVAAASDVVVSCVTASQDVLAVVLDEQRGVIAGVRPEEVVVDCSTVAPDVAKRCADALAERKAGFVDAPISGGDVGAKAGTLSIMCGGRAEDFEKAGPVLEAMGKTVTHCGPSGSGYVVKLCNQVCGALHLVAAAEAVALASAARVNLAAMLKAVSSGAAGSWILQNLAPKMVEGDDKPGFFVDYQLKDLRLANEAAGEFKTPLPGASLAQVLFAAASAQGRGRDGTQALRHVIEGLRTPPG